MRSLLLSPVLEPSTAQLVGLRLGALSLCKAQEIMR